MDYAAKKIKLLQPLQFEQRNIISLLIGGINNFSNKSAAMSINVETIDEFLERMYQLTNMCVATQKKSSPLPMKKKKTKERVTSDSPTKKATQNTNQMSYVLIVKRRVMSKPTAGS